MTCDTCDMLRCGQGAVGPWSGGGGGGSEGGGGGGVEGVGWRGGCGGGVEGGGVLQRLREAVVGHLRTRCGLASTLLLLYRKVGERGEKVTKKRNDSLSITFKNYLVGA